jgi:alpha-galactosidase
MVGEQLALTPPMGWNHWYTHYHYVTDGHIREAAMNMVESGMADVGYSFISIDDCWMRIHPDYAKLAIERKRTGNVNLDTLARMGEPRDETGEIISNDHFPDMPALTKYIHDFGLKAGIYTSPGPRTCQEFEGSWQHEEQDAETFARWGFDLLKYDWCRYGLIFNKPSGKEEALQAYKKPYKKMSRILESQSRDIVLNLCQYGMAEVWKWGKETGHSWRIGGDLGHTINEGGIYKTAEKTIAVREYNGPGGWNDPDYLIMGKWRSPFNKGGDLSAIPLSSGLQYSYMSLWCMMACPLFFSGDMGQIDDFTINVLTNNEMIAVNQDVLGECAAPVRMNDSEWVLKKSLADGSFVVGFFNLDDREEKKIQVKWEELNISGSYLLRDLWRQKDIGQSGKNLCVDLSASGCAVILFRRD